MLAATCTCPGRKEGVTNAYEWWLHDDQDVYGCDD